MPENEKYLVEMTEDEITTISAVFAVFGILNPVRYRIWNCLQLDEDFSIILETINPEEYQRV